MSDADSFLSTGRFLSPKGAAAPSRRSPRPLSAGADALLERYNVPGRRVYGRSVLLGKPLSDQSGSSSLAQSRSALFHRGAQTVLLPLSLDSPSSATPLNALNTSHSSVVSDVPSRDPHPSAGGLAPSLSLPELRQIAMRHATDVDTAQGRDHNSSSIADNADSVGEGGQSGSSAACKGQDLASECKANPASNGCPNRRRPARSAGKCPRKLDERYEAASLRWPNPHLRYANAEQAVESDSKREGEARQSPVGGESSMRFKIRNKEKQDKSNPFIVCQTKEMRLNEERRWLVEDELYMNIRRHKLQSEWKLGRISARLREASRQYDTDPDDDDDLQRLPRKGRKAPAPPPVEAATKGRKRNTSAACVLSLQDLQAQLAQSTATLDPNAGGPKETVQHMNALRDRFKMFLSPTSGS